MANVQTTNGSLQMVSLLINKMFMIEHLDENFMRMTYLAILTPRLDVGIDIIYHIHMERDKKYLYYCSFAQSISIGSKVERSAKRTKFQQTQPHHTSTSYPWLAHLH